MGIQEAIPGRFFGFARIAGDEIGNTKGHIIKAAHQFSAGVCVTPSRAR